MQTEVELGKEEKSYWKEKLLRSGEWEITPKRSRNAVPQTAGHCTVETYWKRSDLKLLIGQLCWRAELHMFCRDVEIQRLK